jgi:hypothetical protein
MYLPCCFILYETVITLRRLHSLGWSFTVQHLSSLPRKCVSSPCCYTFWVAENHKIGVFPIDCFANQLPPRCGIYFQILCEDTHTGLYIVQKKSKKGGKARPHTETCWTSCCMPLLQMSSWPLGRTEIYKLLQYITFYYQIILDMQTWPLTFISKLMG